MKGPASFRGGHIMNKASFFVLAALKTAFAATSLFSFSTAIFAKESDGAEQLRIDIELQLERAPGHAASGVAVSYRLQLPGDMTGKSLTLRFDTLEPFLGRSTDRVTGLVLADAQGDLRVSPDKPVVVEGEEFQTWTTDRAPSGIVQVSYRIPVAVTVPERRGPQYDLQAAGDGAVMSGSGILVLPVTDRPMRVHAAWKLPAGLSSASSFGDGDIDAVVEPKKLLDTLFAAGTFHRFPADTGSKGFSVYGLGQPDYDIDALFAWERQWYDTSRVVFRASADTPFRIYYRSYDGTNNGSGQKLNGVLIIYLPPHLPAGGLTALKQLLAHETMHLWVPNLADDTDADAWYHEGQADYFSRVLPYQYGMTGPREFLSEVNKMAAAYYGSPYRAVRNERIPDIMWKDSISWTTPYTRGFLYLAATNAELQSRTHGKVGVIDLVNQIVDRQRQGEALDFNIWEALLGQYAGQEAVRKFRAMLAGELIMPPADAFGACFVGRRTSIGEFDKGYTAHRGGKNLWIVDSVAAGSNAARAGLSPGDEITSTVDWQTAYSQPAESVTLDINRGGKHEAITYLPRKGSLPAMEWTAKSGNPDAPCGK